MNRLSYFARSGLRAVFALGVVLFATSTNAAMLTVWNFAGNDGDEPSVAATSGDSANFDLPASLIERDNILIEAAANPNTFWGQGWSAEDPNAYFQFSINPLPGTVYNISDVDITPVYADPGPEFFSLYSSQDGFTTALDPDNVNFTGLSGDVVFRLHLFGNEGGEGGASYIAINGSAAGAGVPETFPTWAIGLIFVGLVAARSVESRRTAQVRARA